MGTTTANDAWIILANDHQARLLACARTRMGRCQLIEHASIESPLPVDPGRRFFAPRSASSYSYDDRLFAVQEERRRFARQLVRWMHELLSQHEIARLTLFAPPQLTGYVRDQLAREDRGRIDLREDNLIHLTDDALRRHPAITELLYTHISSPQPTPTAQRLTQHLSDEPAHQSHSRDLGHAPMRATTSRR